MRPYNVFRLLNRRKELKYSRRSTAIHALATFVCLFLILCPTKALANTTITFPNGGTATLNSDGTITGTVTVGEWDDEWGLEYPVTFPDGTTTHARCIDHMHYAPAAGSFTFKATPNEAGSYDVTIDTSVAPHNIRQPPASYLLDPSQRLGELTWSPVVTGKIRVQKTSSMPFLSNNNGCYSLAGARYGIWQDEACTKPVGAQYELITDVEGLSNEVELVPGDYWVKETQAPKGFKLDTTTYHLTLVAGESSAVHVQDTPLYDTPTVWAYKHDVEYSGAQGIGTLEGAEFTIRYYDGVYNLLDLPKVPTRTWVVRSDEAGHIMPTSDTLVSGGGLFRDNSGNVIIPLGTISIQETKAPNGYWLEGQTPESPSDYTGPLHIVNVRNEGDYNAPRVANNIKRAGISLQKVDKESYDVAQGDASLANICFSIINRNDVPIMVDGVVYYPGDSIPDALVTDEEGYACTSVEYLPLGTYEVIETSTNGSMLNTSSPQTITLVENQTNTLVSLDSPMVDDVVRGGIAIGKVSRETSDHAPQGAGTLRGAEFYVVLESEQSVLVNNEWYSRGDVVRELKTDERGIVQTGDRELPYGTYVVREVKAPTGYVLNDQWSQTVSIREDGVVVDCTDTASSADDQVIRGGLTFSKVDGHTMGRMPGVAWSIMSTTTHESHIVVTDENGVVNTETQPHDFNTNANDLAIVDGEVRDDLLDPTAGIWFSGSSDVMTTPIDGFGALPYDTYVVQELPSSANEGYELVWFTVHITNHNETVDLGTVDNTRIPVPSLATTLAYDGCDHVAPVDGEVVLVDTISYEDLEVDESYVMVGNLIDVETYIETQDEEQSTISTASMDFEPDLPSGTTHVTFTVDSSELRGKTIVAFEHLSTTNGKNVASHAIVDDKNQSVWFPDIKTKLAVDEDSLANDDNEHITLVDTVSYKNLVPGLWYRMEGVLMDKDTEEVVCDTLGNVARASKSFMPSEQDGTTDLQFTLDQKSIQGKTLVAFETLLRNDTVLARHEDLNNRDQTVLFPSIRTELTNREGNKVLPKDGTIELIDTVSFSNLEVGKTYELEGMLIDKLTREPLLDEAEIPLIRTRIFTPDQADGTTTIKFNVESGNVECGEIVAFETLRYEGHDICWHRDIDDEAQTVRFPSIHTTLSSPAGTHESIAAQITLTDVVHFCGLKPNEKYVLKGTLMDKYTQEPVTNGDGTELMATKEFEPEASEGTIEVPIELDATSLAGHTLVAYETLYANHDDESQEIAQHADLNDTNQTIAIPRISTNAMNAENGEKSISLSGKAHIRDTVTYQNLCVGASYVMTGTLHNKSTGKVVEQSVVTKSFTPTERNGTVELDFIVDSSILGEGDVVVFESCTREGIEVATHKDLNDENQTVSIRKGSTPRNVHTPGTGEANTWLLVIALALLGVSALIARHILTS